jgi:hypothetical protein
MPLHLGAMSYAVQLYMSHMAQWPMLLKHLCETPQEATWSRLPVDMGCRGASRTLLLSEARPSKQ